MSVPNQKTVTIVQRTKRDKQHLYAMFNLDALKRAILYLNSAGLKLWIYLNKNQDNYKLELSQKACEEWGIKKDSYYAAVKELIGKNYLIPTHTGSHHFYFYENGNGKKPKEFSEEQTGESVNQKPLSKKQIDVSENPQRNSTDSKNNTPNSRNNTFNEKKTKWDLDEIAKKVCEPQNDYSYLENDCILLSDGAFTLPNGKSTWLDVVDHTFYLRPREEQIEIVMEYVRLNRQEAEYAVDVILKK